MAKYDNENNYLTHWKQREILEEFANRRLEEIQDLSKQINFKNLTYHYKGKNIPNVL